MSILSQLSRTASGCFEARLDYLRRVKKYDTSIYEEGVRDCLQRLRNGAKSFVVDGEPQSGKTEFMIALTCRLIDEGYETVYILMNDNTELENQNFLRFQECRQLNPSPIRDFDLQYKQDDHLKSGFPRIIFCRKNGKNLEKLIHHTRFMKKRIVIDDEADFASPNTNINKHNANATAINRHIQKLIDDDIEGGSYIGVTATPARLDVNNTFLNKAEDWIFLRTHKAYLGHAFFFPISKNSEINTNYQLVRLSEKGDSLATLRDAVLRFIIRVAFLNLKKDTIEDQAYTMLVHTSGQINDHEQDKKIIDRLLYQLSLRDSETTEKLYEKIIDIANGISQKENFGFPGLDAAQYIFSKITMNDVLVINHTNDRGNVDRSCNPRAIFTFAIGGNIVSRGLTFNSLLSFFFSRNVKGKFTHNTYIQRARMFGTRPYHKHLELCVPDSLYTNWAECFHEHETALTLLKDTGTYVHVQSGRTQVTESRSIDKDSVISINGETEIGKIFDLTDEISRIITDRSAPAVERLRLLLDSQLLDATHLSRGLVNQLVAYETDRPGSVALVLKQNGEIQTVDQYKDADLEMIRRQRGGMIQATVHKVVEYEHALHCVMPVRNLNGRARFIYKAVVDKSYIENILHV